MYGVEFVYMRRYYINEKTILKEVSSSSFESSFPIEGYIESYEGFDSGYNLLTKFGVRSTAEMKIVISQDRYQNYIVPLVAGNTGRNVDPTRPLEGDLLYFPYRDLLLEIKYVDDVSNFYQLRKNYTYTLTCEPFEYEDEVINTGITAIDDDMQTAGYNATLVLTAVGTTATASVSLASGISHINLLNGGVNYTADPAVKIAPPLASGGIPATAVAITTSIGFTDSRRIRDIFITNPGSGYTMAPSIQFLPEDGKGSGADATVGISSGTGVGQISLDNTGSKYMVPPSVTFTAAPSGGVTATAVSILNDNGSVQAIRLTTVSYTHLRAHET